MARAKVYRWRIAYGIPLSWMAVVRDAAGRIVTYDHAATHAEAMALACFWLGVLRQFDETPKEG